MHSVTPLLTPAQRELLERLSEPFDPEEIKWIVKDRNISETEGRIFPYADPRAYTDRLNDVVTALGWNAIYSITTIQGISHVRNDQTVPSGKVMLVCVLTIEGLGSKPGTGEEWADGDNAMTGADAQALKRACVKFGLGRYLYNFGEVWVPLDGLGNPAFIPELPQWALPSKYRTESRPTGSRVVQANRQATPKLIDAKLISKIESFRRLLGDAIYMEILNRAGHCRTARSIPTAERQRDVIRCMEKAARGVHRVVSLSRRVGMTQFVAEMDALRLTSANAIPSLALLTKLVANLETITGQRAA